METSVVAKKVGIRDLFQHKSYFKLLTANFISRFGDSVDAVAYSWMVYILTGSKVLMGTLFAVNCIPNLIFGAFSGVLVDHFPKKKIIILADFGRGTVVCITAVLYLTGVLRPWHLFIFTFLNSTFETFSGPARSSIFPLLLPKELFLTASSFSGSASSFAELAGLGVVGFIIALTGISGAIFVDSATFFISCIIISFIRINGDVVSNETLTMKKYVENLRDGFIFIRKQALIFVTILLAAFANFCFTPFNVLEPAYVKDVLKAGPNALSFLGIAITIGIILGGLVVGQFGASFKKSHLIISGFFCIGISYALFSIPGSINILGIPPIFIAMVVGFIFAFFIPVTFSPVQAYFMENTPKELIGRLSSIMGILTMSAIPIASALTGAISEYVPIQTFFIVLGILISITAVSLIFNRDFCNA